MSMPIYRVMAQKREDKEREELEKKEKEEVSIQLDEHIIVRTQIWEILGEYSTWHPYNCARS